jgi:alpha-soluble NSF attachment protein
MVEARKALNRTTLFGFGKQQKYEDAADYFTKAGNAYKLANAFEEAGQAFLECSRAWDQAGDNKSDVVNSIVEAGNCFKKVNPVEAVNSFQKAIELYNESGRVGMSARYYKEIAEIFEADHNTASAMEAYEQAAKMFELDKKQSNSNTCMLKVAQYASENGDLKKAAGIYESIGRESMSSRLGQYAAKGYFLQALLCYLAMGDAVQVNNKTEDYKNADYSFGASRECDFVQKLTKVPTIIFHYVTF